MHIACQIGCSCLSEGMSLGSQPLSAAPGAPDPTTRSYLGILPQGNCSSCPRSFAREQMDSLCFLNVY